MRAPWTLSGWEHRRNKREREVTEVILLSGWELRGSESHGGDGVDGGSGREGGDWGGVGSAAPSERDGGD